MIILFRTAFIISDYLKPVHYHGIPVFLEGSRHLIQSSLLIPSDIRSNCNSFFISFLQDLISSYLSNRESEL